MSWFSFWRGLVAVLVLASVPSVIWLGPMHGIYLMLLAGFFEYFNLQTC